LGFTLRRFDLPESLEAFRSSIEPAYRWLAVISAAETTDRPDKRRFPGSCPPEEPLRSRGFKPSATGASRGVCPLGPATKTLARTYPGLLSPASRVLAITRRTRRRLRVSIDPRFASPDDVPGAKHRRVPGASTRVNCRPKQPLWVSCTCPLLSIRVRQRLGY
jgi:hypothetical protein